ncbi:MAG: HDOD domain-containing protein [Gammaproteobacteria bacterium]|nr:HDOD domain-containing protein [Gammaproteobacteria bacterium]
MPKSVFQLSDGEVITSETPEERKQREIESFPVQDFVNAVREDLRTNNINLPTLPTLALEALLVINDAGSSAADLEKVISKDAALTARLIRYANSPLYRGTHTITSIKLAITRIGFQRVKNAVYAVSMKEVFRTPIKAIERRMEKLWGHSVKVGAHAAMLAKQHHRLDPDIALVAGLVHDIGKIPLLIKACEYEEMTRNPEFLDRLLDKLHPQLGSSIIKLWKFDPRVVDVAAQHEDLKRDPGDAPVDYVDLVQVANILSHEGTDHPLATIDRQTVQAFARVFSNPDENDTLRLDDDTQAVAELVF